MKTKALLFFVVFACLFSTSYAQDQDTVNQELSDLEYQIALNYLLDSIEATLNYETGEVTLQGDIALINVPSGFKFLNGEQSEMILVDIWGNPPSEPGTESLGMLVPDNFRVIGDSVYAINITYSEDGHIDDSDAKDIDYDELLASMQEDVKVANEYRVQNGYETVELVGWASPPFYDEANKKLHWAKELRFEGTESNTLNYNIRVLGRKGYLNLNVIGDMQSLQEIQGNIDPILASVNFTSGNTYADFDPSIDQVAAVGIGGLIAGKVLAKAGILAKLGILLAKFWKVILVGVIAVGAGLRRFFGGGNKDPETQQQA